MSSAAFTGVPLGTGLAVSAHRQTLLNLFELVLHCVRKIYDKHIKTSTEKLPGGLARGLSR